MDAEANKAIVRRYIETWNTGQVALADELLAPTYQVSFPFRKRSVPKTFPRC
jgi:hypothetical protein